MRRAVPLLLGLLLAGCGGHGAEGIEKPPPTDFSHFVRPSAPHTALAASEGFSPKPDYVTQVYPVPAATLFAIVTRVAGEMPRTWPLIAYPGRLQARWVARSAVFNFPDVITADVSPYGPAASTLILYSASIYGHYDFGVNRARVRAWLAAIDRIITDRPD